MSAAFLPPPPLASYYPPPHGTGTGNHYSSQQHHHQQQQQQPTDSYLNNYPLVYQVFNLPTANEQTELYAHTGGTTYQRNYQQNYYEDPSAPLFITEAEPVSLGGVSSNKNQQAGVDHHKK